jgi:hypothetical protein
MQKWNDTLWLLTEYEFSKLPDGFVLTCIDNTTVIKGKDYIDMDIRFGHTAYGVVGPLLAHPEAELLTKIKLSVAD